ncbi:MAG: methyltransferase domain-containing protein [Bryobacteraceae bacterium]
MRNHIAEWVLKQIALRGERRAKHDDELRSESARQYFQWQLKTSDDLFRRYPDFDVTGKRVLDIGCGVGGRCAYLARRGAAQVVGIDINAAEIELAKQVCAKVQPELMPAIQFLVSREDTALPEIGQFDLVLLVDAMEHVVSPPSILRLAYDYVRPGGKCCFNTIGWYNYHGSHCGYMPWLNLFFSDETIINVIRWSVSRADYRRTSFDSDPPLERWRGIYNLRDRPGEHLNKITISELKKLVRYTIFRSATLTIVPFGSRNPLVRLFNPLRHVPVLQEVFHSGVVVELIK